MSNRPFPALCRECKWGRPEDLRQDRPWMNVCTNPNVIAQHPWALANNREGEPAYPSCHEERGRRSPFAACGIKGKKWEARNG